MYGEYAKVNRHIPKYSKVFLNNKKKNVKVSQVQNMIN